MDTQEQHIVMLIESADGRLYIGAPGEYWAECTGRGHSFEMDAGAILAGDPVDWAAIWHPEQPAGPIVAIYAAGDWYDGPRRRAHIGALALRRPDGQPIARQPETIAYIRSGDDAPAAGNEATLAQAGGLIDAIRERLDRLERSLAEPAGR